MASTFTSFRITASPAFALIRVWSYFNPLMVLTTISLAPSVILPDQSEFLFGLGIFGSEFSNISANGDCLGNSFGGEGRMRVHGR